jgi:hypothetical protein
MKKSEQTKSFPVGAAVTVTMGLQRGQAKVITKPRHVTLSHDERFIEGKAGKSKINIIFLQQP